MKPFRRAFHFALIGAVAISLIATAAFAQGKMRQGGPEGDGVAMRANMAACLTRAADELGLTEQQRAQIRERVEICRRQAMEMKNSKITPEQKRLNFRQMHEQCREEISQVLTPEQLERAKQMWSERKLAFQGKRGPGQRAHLGMAKLDLTPQQKEQITAVRQRTRELVQGIRANAALTDAQKAEQITAVRRDAHEQVLAVLTPEQREKLEAWKASRQGAGKQGWKGARPGGLGKGVGCCPAGAQGA